MQRQLEERERDDIQLGARLSTQNKWAGPIHLHLVHGPQLHGQRASSFEGMAGAPRWFHIISQSKHVRRKQSHGNDEDNPDGIRWDQLPTWADVLYLQEWRETWKRPLWGRSWGCFSVKTLDLQQSPFSGKKLFTNRKNAFLQINLELTQHPKTFQFKSPWALTHRHRDVSMALWAP